jgi:hypothetical protein
MPSVEPTVIHTESKVLSDINFGLGSEPSIAISPTDPNLVAATYVQIDDNNLNKIQEMLAISHDGGSTWDKKKINPMKQSSTGAHPRIIFDENNTLWLTNTDFVYGGASDGISYSKDLGKTWHAQLRKDAGAWVGRFPDITADTDSSSPNYGVVAATYNFNKGNLGSGIRVAVTPDKGKSWQMVDASPVEFAGFPVNWLINSQLVSLPNDYFLLSYSEVPMKGIDVKDPVNGWNGASKKMVYATVLIRYDKTLNKLTAEKPVVAIELPTNWNAQWQSEMGVDKTTGRVWITASSYGANDSVYVGDSDDYGKTWHWQTMGPKGSQNFKSVLAVADNGTVFVGWHTMGAKKMVSSHYAIAYGDGVFSEPKLATKTTFSLNPKILNGDGLREQATAGLDGKFYWAFGIGNNGKSNVNLVAIDPGK